MNIRKIYSGSTVLLMNDRVIKYDKALLLEDDCIDKHNQTSLTVLISKRDLENSSIKDMINHIYIPETKIMFISLDKCVILRTAHDFKYTTDVVINNIDDVSDETEYYQLKFIIISINIEFFNEKIKQE